MKATSITYASLNGLVHQTKAEPTTTKTSISSNKREDKQLQNSATRSSSLSYFKMPLHYPRFSKADYERMPEWMLDRLLAEYGLPISGDVDDKRKFAIGAFLWPDQLSDH